MNWSDEIYVRVYTRDTITWKLLGWEGRCVLSMLFRKVDRAGCIDVEGGVEGLSLLLDLPADVTVRGLAACLKRGTVTQSESTLIIPKFTDAQEARHSDKLRQKESRARRRELATRGIAPDRAPTFVYYVQAVADSTIKIGYAADVASRVRNIANGRPDIVRLLHSQPGGPTEERAEHERWAASRIGSSEWFSASDELLAHIANLVQTVTARDTTSPDVTRSHPASHDVTLSIALNSIADPPKSPKGPGTGESKAKPQAQADDSALASWEAIQKGAGGPQALGLARNYGQLNGTWLDDNKASLWASNWSVLRALERPPTLTLCEKLGRWLVAGQKPIPSPWQCLAKGGNHANVGAWFDQAEEWDGVSDPRARQAAPRAPPAEPDYPAHRPMEQTAAQRRKRELEAEARAAAEPKKP